MPDDNGISQDDIDALLNPDSGSNKSSDEPKPVEEKASEPAESPEDDKISGETVSSEEIDKMLAQASSRNEPQEEQPKPPETRDARPFDFKNITPAESAEGDRNILMLMDVNLNLRVELGRRKLNIEDVLRLGEGSVVELDKLAGDPLDILVNDRLVARGEVLVLNDSFCIRVTSIVMPEESHKG